MLYISWRVSIDYDPGMVEDSLYYKSSFNVYFLRWPHASISFAGTMCNCTCLSLAAQWETSGRTSQLTISNFPRLSMSDETMNVQTAQVRRERYVLMTARCCWSPSTAPPLKLGQYNQRNTVPKYDNQFDYFKEQLMNVVSKGNLMTDRHTKL